MVELAQNAADAAAAAGVPGRLLLRVEAGTLYAANVGTPLSAAGVEALSHLRVSPKEAGHVGRYGVGFKAVLAVTDSPAIVSRTGGVGWSATETGHLVTTAAKATPALSAELERRGGHVPVMRLPFPATADETAAALLQEWDTVVVLPLRDPDSIGALLDRFDATTLLFLPGLASLDVDGRLLTAGKDWVVHRASGELDPALLADRPVEERERPGWTVTWAVHLDADGRPEPYGGDRLLHAPQPTDEPLDFPALLALSVPLEPGRRSVVTGPLTDWLVARAAEEYATLLATLPGVPRLADLVPHGFPAGAIDLLLRDALPGPLAKARLLASAADPAHRLRPDEAVVLDCGAASEALTALLAPLVTALVDPQWAAGSRRAALTALGVRVLDTADVVDLLHGLEQPPAWWASAYGALAAVPDRDALRALPVPLADGRVVTGPRDLLLPTDAGLAEAATGAGLALRWVHPDAVHELLRGLGARDLDAAALLDELREAVERSLDDEPPVDPDALARLVLGTVSPALAAERPWLAELALPDTDGELRAAGELLLPAYAGGRLAAIVDPSSPFGTVADVGPADALQAVGVLCTFAVVRDTDVATDPDLTDHWLDGEAGWLESLGHGVVAEMAAVRDLEWVRDWTLAWTELASLWDVVTEPVTLLLQEGGTARAPSYTAWWLRSHACVPLASGELARPVAGTGTLQGRAAELAALLGATGRAQWLLDTLPDVELGDLRRVYAELAATHDDLDAPLVVRAVRDGCAVTVAAADAVVVDAPDLLPLVADRAVVPVALADAVRLADVLDVALASEVVDGVVTSAPVASCAWPEGVAELLGGLPVPSYAEHDPLVAGGSVVPWRVVAGVAHVDRSAGVGAVARAASWLAGRWDRRDTLAAYLAADPATRATLRAEAALD